MIDRGSAGTLKAEAGGGFLSLHGSLIPGNVSRPVRGRDDWTMDW